MQFIPDKPSTQILQDYIRHPAVCAAREAADACGSRLYLVGGAVRDALMSGPRTDDLDMVVLGMFDECAERLARVLRGKRIPWESGQSRIAYTLHGVSSHIDLAECRGASIEEDLVERDFTINAIALDVNALFDNSSVVLIDPQQGAADILARTIRFCSRHIFDADPLRLLRAIRIARVSGCAIDQPTYALMRSRNRLIRLVAPERLKRELFTILGASGTRQSLREGIDTGVLTVIMPELWGYGDTEQGPPHEHDVLSHTLRTVECLDRLCPRAGSGRPGLNERMQRHLQEPIEEGVSRRALLMFAALLHDGGKCAARTVSPDGSVRFPGHARESCRQAETIARRLGLGRQATRIVCRIVDLHMRVVQLSLVPDVSCRAKTRLLYDAEEEAPELMLLAMADARATSRKASYAPTRDRVAALAAELLERALCDTEAPEPRQLISGTDIMDVLAISAGPRVGALLRALHELERTGRIHSRQEALQWLRAQKSSA